MTFLETVRDLALKEPKTQTERLIKLMEETGELAVEIGIRQKLSGFKDKEEGKDGVQGEAVDIILVALSIFFKDGGSVNDFIALALKKSARWQAHQENL